MCGVGRAAGPSGPCSVPPAATTSTVALAMASASASSSLVDELEGWEEWEPSKGSFRTHMIAGSLAGVAEHLAMYPVDTFKVRRGTSACIRGACAALRGEAAAPPAADRLRT